MIANNWLQAKNQIYQSCLNGHDLLKYIVWQLSYFGFDIYINYCNNPLDRKIYSLGLLWYSKVYIQNKLYLSHGINSTGYWCFRQTIIIWDSMSFYLSQAINFALKYKLSLGNLYLLVS